MVEAGVQAGYPRTEDLNGYQQEGFGLMDRTVTAKGRRASTARGYLDRAKHRENLTIVTHAVTDRVLFSGKHAIGVAYLHRGERVSAHVRREVLVCSGAIASPQLLQRSGVGRASWLRELEIPVVHDLPGVGENLQDHLEMYMQLRIQGASVAVSHVALVESAGRRTRMDAERHGHRREQPVRGGRFHPHARRRSLAEHPDHFLPVAINYNGSNAIKMHGFEADVCSMRSPSRGRVKLKSRDPKEHPSILFNYMADPLDWREFRDAIRITREIMRQPALARYRGRELNPGEGMQTDAEIDAFVRAKAATAYHPSCSYKMGIDDMAVVDGEGRVHGMQGLRVVDASIMPQITTGNLNAPTIMLAEKIADRIRRHEALAQVQTAYFVAGGKRARDSGWLHKEIVERAKDVSTLS